VATKVNKFSDMEEILEVKEAPTRTTHLMAKVGKRLGWPEDTVTELIHPEQIFIVRLPVKSWGKVLPVWACISLHNSARGPYKGGIRIAEDVSLWETMELSRLMTLKTSVSDIEFGGGKSGIKVSMKQAYRLFGKTERDPEFEKVITLDICAEFAHQIRRFLMDHTYIPAPDMGTGPDEMAFIYNETLDPASVTGKPEGIQGWLPGRKEATGYGCSYAAMCMITDVLNLDPKKATVAVQGFGNVGSYLCVFLAKQGVKIVGVTDVGGGCYDPKGLDIDALIKYAATNRTVDGFTSKKLTNKELFALPVDIIVPAAAGGVITAENANEIKAKAIVEAANAPVTIEGMAILDQRDIKVFPDIITNSGGVIASMEEYSRSLSAMKITKEEVFKIITEKISAALNWTIASNKKDKVNFVEAAIDLSMRRVYNAMRKRRHI